MDTINIINMNPTFKTIPRANVASQPKNCYLCDANVQSVHIRNVDQLFFEDPKKSQLQSKSLATILTDILEQSVEESTVHSKIVCRKCQLMCTEYDRLAARLQDLKQNITNNFNETANKYNLKVIEMELGQNFDTINDGDDGNISNMYAIESVDSAISEVFNNVENVVVGSGSGGGGSISSVVGGGSVSGVHDTGKNAQMKKVMLIKSENGPNPFFAISRMDEGIDDDQAIHTVSNDNQQFFCLFKNIFFKKNVFL